MLQVLKVSLAIFIAANLFEMGLRLNLQDVMKGLNNFRFVAYTLLWGFVLSPAIAYGITLIIPLESPYIMGFILLGMSPCAPFLPMLLRDKGDVGYTAAFMLMASTGTVIFMPLIVPVMVNGLSVSVWEISKPMLTIILIPLVIGMLTLYYSKERAADIQPVVKKITILFAINTLGLSVVVFGEGLLNMSGYVFAALVTFFLILTTCTYWLGVGLEHEQKIVLSTGMTTRNLGAAVAPLFSVPDIDERTLTLIVLAAPVMIISALVSVRIFERTKKTLEA
jgi:bile acid:Na+ symporter, BASS family